VPLGSGQLLSLVIRYVDLSEHASLKPKRERFNTLLHRGMVTKSFLKNTAACRELFFSEDLPEEQLSAYQALLRSNASSVPVIDVSHVTT